jgi:hypothetical protein
VIHGWRISLRVQILVGPVGTQGELGVSSSIPLLDLLALFLMSRADWNPGRIENSLCVTLVEYQQASRLSEKGIPRS